MTPKTFFDFTTASLGPLVTFTRTTGASNPATFINSSGYLSNAANNQPRFNYNPTTLKCSGLLVEESRTNDALHSEDFILGDYSGVTFSAGVNPRNETNNCLVIPNNGQVFSQLTCRVTRTANGAGTFAMSIFGKAKEFNSIRLICFDAGNSGYYTEAIFNLLNNTFTVATTRGASFPPTGLVATMTPMRDGWYLCTFKFVANTPVSIYRMAYCPWDSVATIGNGVSGVYMFGAQSEIGEPTSYIPTTTTALTRNADVATITGSNFSDFWQATRGGASVLATSSTVSGIRPLVQFDDNTADNIIALRGNTTDPELYIKATTDQAQIDAGTIAANTAYRLAGTWATDNCAANLNGGVPVLDTSATIPTATQMRLGSDGTNYLNGHLQSIEYYNERILNSNLQVVSSPAGYRSIIGPVLRDSIIT